MDNPRAQSKAEATPLSTGLRAHAWLGLGVVGAVLAGFTLWASTAPISSAIVAQGSFVVTGQNKTVQHLEGGIIKSIRVREGEVVDRGQVLVVLDETPVEALLSRFEIKRYRLLATRARLQAERGGHGALSMPAELEAAAARNEDAAEIVGGQHAEFKARLDKFNADRSILDQRIAAIREEISGIEAQKRSLSRQLQLIRDELKETRTLWDKKLTSLAKLLALERSEAKLEGDVGDVTSRVGRELERTIEAQSEIARLTHGRVADASEQLRTAEGELADVVQQIRSQKDVLARLEVRSPVRGIVVKVLYHTTGGVISPSQPILELLPTEGEQLVEALIRPSDIEGLTVGATARLRLVAFKQRVIPLIEGRVIHISADTIKGKSPQETGYLARVEVDKAAAAKMTEFKPVPGMPVEVYIETGSRTFFSYLLKPVTDSLARAFRET